ncbi:MAG: hypothetical protein U0414_11490 [Polyangiaceae bacterium]
MSERWMKNLKKRRYLLIGVNVTAAALVGVAALAGAKGDAIPLLDSGANALRDLDRLERAAAVDPTPTHLASLATTYLDVKQPGLAVSLLETHREVQSPELTLLRGRAYYSNGHSTKALEYADDLTSTCTSSIACPPWVGAMGQADRAYFSELVQAGIEDAAEDPEGAQAAYRRSRHEIHLVAIR